MDVFYDPQSFPEHKALVLEAFGDLLSRMTKHIKDGEEEADLRTSEEAILRRHTMVADILGIPAETPEAAEVEDDLNEELLEEAHRSGHRFHRLTEIKELRAYFIKEGDEEIPEDILVTTAKMFRDIIVYDAVGCSDRIHAWANPDEVTHSLMLFAGAMGVLAIYARAYNVITGGMTEVSPPFPFDHPPILEGNA